MFRDSKATFRSRGTVAGIAAAARQSAGLSSEININLVDYIYGFLRLRIKNSLDIVINETLEHNADAFVRFLKDEKIQLNVKTSIWQQAKQNFSGARFIMAHEVGHIIMHKNDALAYSNAPYSVVRALAEEDRAEPQANWFADEFLAPLDMIDGLNSVYDVAEFLNVPEKCARRQLELCLDNQRRRGIASPYSDMCPNCGSLTLGSDGKCSNGRGCI